MTTVLEPILKRFPSQQDCIRHLEQVRWEGKPRCPYCKSRQQSSMPKEQRYHCNGCRASYSATVRTPFHKSKVPLHKWFAAIPLVIENNVSGRQLGSQINVTKDTACFMVNRIKIAFKQQLELIQHFLST